MHTRAAVTVLALTVAWTWVGTGLVAAVGGTAKGEQTWPKWR